MRIISGLARGRKLVSPKNMRVRPTADRVKESLFNILTNLIEDFSDIVTLDIFAGTGNLGIEALSRGSKYAVFIDSHRQSAAMIAKNLDLLGFTRQARVIVEEALTGLQVLEKGQEQFGLIFLDPPYAKGYTETILDALSRSSVVNDQTIVVAEFATHEDIGIAFGRLQQFDRRGYGDTVLAFFNKTNPED